MKLVKVTKVNGEILRSRVGDESVESFISENRHLWGQDDVYEPGVIKEAWTETIPPEVEGEEPTVINHPEELGPVLKTPKDWSVEVIDIDHIEDCNSKARVYLDSTDWYVVRFVEEQIPVPEEVAEKRRQSRDIVVHIDTL